MILQSTKIWIVDHFMSGQLEIKEGLIQAIYSYNKFPADLDVGDLRIVPGFIDIHTHGGYGFDSMHPEQNAFDHYTIKLAHEGVTSFLISTITENEKVLQPVLNKLSNLKSAGAQKLGIHLEGPFLSKKYKGAHNEEQICEPSFTEFQGLQKYADHQIKMVTVKAENDLDYSFIRECAEDSVVVSLGHSNSTYEQAQMAVANGVTSFTHVYNAMSPFKHRDPGLVGAALNFPGVYGEIICDGIHSHFASTELFFKTKGPYFSIMVSDSLSLKGLPAGSRADFSREKIEMDEKGKILIQGTQTIAGSALRMNQALKNMVQNTDVPFATLINSLSRNPAALLGLKNKGVLQAGKDADLIVLSDDYEVVHCFIKGTMIF